MSATGDHIAADRLAVWVLEPSVTAETHGRLGDARRLADSLGCSVGVVVVSGAAEELIATGADRVVRVTPESVGADGLLVAAQTVLRDHPARLVLTGYDPESRALAARLAVRNGWLLVSPSLMFRTDDGELTITHVDHFRRRARQIVVENDRTAVVTMRDGVGMPAALDSTRRGSIVELKTTSGQERVVCRRHIPLDPATADIRSVRRLVSGGRGIGGREGFDRLQRIAKALDAGVAASRVAVDLGWIEYDRQVGQTGKTVRPHLYLACGISGATHHWEGMSESEHIVAINTDPEAPLLKRAHLALVADLHQVLAHVEQVLDGQRQ